MCIFYDENIIIFIVRVAFVCARVHVRRPSPVHGRTFSYEVCTNNIRPGTLSRPLPHPKAIIIII